MSHARNALVGGLTECQTHQIGSDVMSVGGGFTAGVLASRHLLMKAYLFSANFAAIDAPK